MNLLKSTFRLTCLTLLLVALGSAIGGQSGMLIAFATGRNPQNAAVAATEGIMRILSAKELEGVMAHELAHVQNRDTLISTISAIFSGAISMLGSMLQWAVIFGAGHVKDEAAGVLIWSTAGSTHDTALEMIW